MTPLALVLGVLLELSALGEPSRAPEGPALSWEVPAQCMDDTRARDRLGELLSERGPDGGAGGGGIERVEVQIREVEAGFAVRLRFIGGRGVDEREFVDESCAIAAEAALLVIAVSYDPVATTVALAPSRPAVQRPSPPEQSDEPEPSPPEQSDEPEPGPEDPAPPELAPTPTLEPAPTFEPERRRRPARRSRSGPRSTGVAGEASSTRVGLGLLGGASFGPLDLWQGQLGAELSVFGPLWRASVHGLWHTPRTVRYAPPLEGRYQGFAVGARGCVVPSLPLRATVELPVCLGGEAGLIRGEGVAPTPNPRAATVVHGSLILAPGLRWVVLERMALTASLDLLVGLGRAGFTLDEDVAQSLVGVGLRPLIGLELRLP